MPQTCFHTRQPIIFVLYVRDSKEFVYKCICTRYVNDIEALMMPADHTGLTAINLSLNNVRPTRTSQAL